MAESTQAKSRNGFRLKFQSMIRSVRDFFSGNNTSHHDAHNSGISQSEINDVGPPQAAPTQTQAPIPEFLEKRKYSPPANPSIDDSVLTQSTSVDSSVNISDAVFTSYSIDQHAIHDLEEQSDDDNAPPLLKIQKPDDALLADEILKSATAKPDKSIGLIKKIKDILVAIAVFIYRLIQDKTPATEPATENSSIQDEDGDWQNDAVASTQNSFVSCFVAGQHRKPAIAPPPSQYTPKPRVEKGL